MTTKRKILRWKELQADTCYQLLEQAIDGEIRAFIFATARDFIVLRDMDVDCGKTLWKPSASLNSTDELRSIDKQLADGYLGIPRHVLRKIEANGISDCEVGLGSVSNHAVEIYPKQVAEQDLFFFAAEVDAVDERLIATKVTATTKVTWDDITITFMPNNRLAYSIHEGKKVFKLFSDLNLIDIRSGMLKKHALVLTGLANGKKYPDTKKSTNAQRSLIKRLRSSLITLTGIESDPFFPFNSADGWRPRFKLISRQHAADERAKEKAIHNEYLDEVEYPYQDDNAEDEADAWLKTLQDQKT